MRELVKQFILNAKAQTLIDVQKRLKSDPIQSAFSQTHENCINQQSNIIDLVRADFERMDIASAQLEKAREHLVGAMASLEGFEGLSKRELLLAANFTHGYIYMLGEFIRQKQERTAKPVKGLVRLNG